MIVLTIEQKGSRREANRVPELLEKFAGVQTIAGFERTVGDEIQGLVEGAGAACEAIRIAIRMGGWHVGIGVGQVDDDALAEIRSGTIRNGRGSAFLRACEAVERAKKYPVSIAVIAVDGAGASEGTDAHDRTHGNGEGSLSAQAALQAVLQLIGVMVASRTPAQREVVELLAEGMTGREIATVLAISEPSVSRRRRLAHVSEEDAAWPVVENALAELDAAVGWARELSECETCRRPMRR